MLKCDFTQLIESPDKHGITMNVLLISPGLVPRIKYENMFFTKLFWKESIAIPHIGLASLAASLENKGHAVKIIDGSSVDLTSSTLSSIINQFKPKLIGISVTSYTLENSILLAKRIKTNFDIPIVIGGAHVNIYPRESLWIKSVDFAIYGDGEDPLVELVEAIEHAKDFSTIRNLCYRKNRQIIVNDPRPLNPLDKYPFPAIHLLDMAQYSYFFKEKEKFMVMFTSRGCVYDCNFCSMSTSVYRLRSVENVIAEIERYYFQLGIRTIHFYDDCFTANRSWVLKFIDTLGKKKIHIAWSCLTRADRVDDELLDRMAKAGCFLIKYGIESGDPRMLKIMNKRTNLNNLYNAIHLTKKHNISPLGFFMIGIPGETMKSIQNTIRFILNSELDYIRVSRYTAMPNTKLYTDYINAGNVDFWKLIMKGKMRDYYQSLEDYGINGEKLDKIVKGMYLKFFLRPSRAIQLFLKEPARISHVTLLIKSLLVVLSFFIF